MLLPEQFRFRCPYGGHLIDFSLTSEQQSAVEALAPGEHIQWGEGHVRSVVRSDDGRELAVQVGVHIRSTATYYIHRDNLLDEIQLKRAASPFSD